MKKMNQQDLAPDYIFETSWEVCNKVGGIYTVLSSRAKTLQATHPDRLFFIGPDFHADETPFTEDRSLLPSFREALAADGLQVRIGRWEIPGRPVALLVDYTPLRPQRDQIYHLAWEYFGVDSLHAYGDYDDASLFSVAAGRVAEVICQRCLPQQAHIVYQAHEWMSGMGMLFLKKALPRVATIFTTHATSIGRSIAGNNKLLYKYFNGYHGDQMAAELSMEAKHSIEKQSARQADCFTTVSTFTAAECTQLLDKTPDVVLPNGFEADFVPQGLQFGGKRRTARNLLLKVAEALTGQPLPSDTFIISTSGRNDFRCKGFDVYMEALARLNARLKAADAPHSVLALIEVPCWVRAPREDLLQRLKEMGKTPRKKAQSSATPQEPLPLPILTHSLHHLHEDRIVNMLRQVGFDNAPGSAVKVMLIPTYLEGHDGIFNVPYYDLLTANDLCIYPSYYEPWGYTPLESCAFKTPCITTDLCGFGQWVNELFGRTATLRDGVSVIHRDDDNYFESADAIVDDILTLLSMTTTQRNVLRHNAEAIAAKAEWKHFIVYYQQAYRIALQRTAESYY
jgi:glycosyltransferase involved in cell wall biosynthesis